MRDQNFEARQGTRSSWGAQGARRTLHAFNTVSVYLPCPAPTGAPPSTDNEKDKAHISRLKTKYHRSVIILRNRTPSPMYHHPKKGKVLSGSKFSHLKADQNDRRHPSQVSHGRFEANPIVSYPIGQGALRTKTMTLAGESF